MPPVGLFGLQTKASPAPADAAAMAVRSRVPSGATGMARTSALVPCAVRAGDSNVGEADTSALPGPVNASVTARRISPDPAASMMCWAGTPCALASAAVSSLVASPPYRQA